MALTDSFGRVIRYLRLSVTDRCNLFCTYCRLPNEAALAGSHHLLTFEEMVRLVRLFLELGVERIRLTGGEPLLRRNIVDLVQVLAQLPGMQELSLSTNAVLLEQYAVPLRKAGLQRVNVSLDSLTPAIFTSLTQRGARTLRAHCGGEADTVRRVTPLSSVLAGIRAARDAGLNPVKINMVVMRGINDHEVPDMVQFAKKEGVLLRFIEIMPVGEAGVGVSHRFISAEEIFEIICAHFGTRLLSVPHAPEGAPEGARAGSGPARYFSLAGMDTEVGVISARSRHFCKTCNRMRLTSKGGLVYCLGQTDRMDLKTPMRDGATDDQLKAQMRRAVSLKPAQHNFEHIDPKGKQTRMSGVGG